MSCASYTYGKAAGKSSKSSCAFAAEKLALWKSRIDLYARMEMATEKMMREDKVDIHIASQDLALLSKKIHELSGKMGGLKQCLAVTDY
jgi:hypothetical protein